MNTYCNNELLTALRQCEFACVELNLYLDTHPDDEEMLCEFNKYSKMLRALKAKYDAEVSPLQNFGFSPFSDSRWVTTPWPWECH
jgi:spore coat protein JB